MAKNSITVTHSIFIDLPGEKVWDFTQDYKLRHTWDDSIAEAKIMETSPKLVVQLRTKTNISMVFEYKLFDRPHKTTLAIKETNSDWIIGGGGSWLYESKDGGTLWTQTNTLIFNPSKPIKLILPIIKFIFLLQTKSAMKKAAQLLNQM